MNTLTAMIFLLWLAILFLSFMVAQLSSSLRRCWQHVYDINDELKMLRARTKEKHGKQKEEA